MGSSLVKLRITGNSHCGCLKTASEAMEMPAGVDLKVAGLVYGPYQREPFSSVSHGRLELHETPRLAKFRARLNIDHIENDGALWAVCMLPETDWSLTKDFPVDAHQCMKWGMQFVLGMQSVGIEPIIIHTPPMRRDNYEIVKPQNTIVPTDAYFRGWLDRWCHDHDFRVIRPPSETMDEDGYLKIEFSMKNPDRNHANSAYGEIMLRLLFAELRIQSEESKEWTSKTTLQTTG